MNRTTPFRVGIIGFGNIGAQLVQVLQDDPAYEVAFIHSRTKPDLDSSLAQRWCDDLNQFEEFSPDLIVEAAHPVYTEEFGTRFLRSADYLTLSTTALVDDSLLAELEKTASENGTRLLLPKGALIGLNALLEMKDVWEEVSITFIKNPGSLPSDGQMSESSSEVLFEGPVREVAKKFPRNVNSMVTLALATIGLDRCQGRLVSDTSTDRGIIDIQARGSDGSELRFQRSQPMVGVSGTEMFASTLGSLRLSSPIKTAGIDFV